jgi:aminocarboxymuconate-semialdehyde decarboxylase
MTVIDSQTHWYPRLLWEAYLDLEDYPRCRRDGDGFGFELAPDRWFPIRPSFYDLETQMEEIDAAGIDVTFSSSGSFGDVDRLELGKAKEVALALNEARAEAEREYSGRFYGVATIPWQDTDAAIEALDDAVGRLGLKAVLVHSNIDGAPIDSEHCRPIFRRIAEHGIPVFMHPARSLAEDQLRDYGLEYLVGYMFDTSTAALRLVLSGIMAENPELKVVHPHCGATLPYLAGRIDESHSKPYSLGEALAVAPSEQMTRFYTDTMCQSAETLQYALDFYRDGHVIFASDYPYFPLEEGLSFVRESVPEAAEQEAILAGNVAALLGLEVA